MHRVTRLTLLSLLALATTACDDDDDPTGPDDAALLRIVNAMDVADVQVRVIGTTTPIATDLDFRESTATCVEVPEGEHALEFSITDVVLATTAATFEEGESYTAVLVASGATRRAVILSDDETAAAGSNGLRFINGTTAAGDVYVTPPAGALTAGFLASGNMGVLATSNAMPDYLNRDVAHTQVRLFDPGVTTGAPRADLTLTGLPASRLATVVFVPAGAPPGPTSFMVTPCL